MARLYGILAVGAVVGIGILLLFAPESLAPWVDLGVRPVITALVAAGLGVVLTSILVRAHQAYRFGRLVKAAERIAAGDYTAYVAPRGTGLESRLAQAVNEIAAALVDTHDRA
ncbi:MAG TPA: hypothetical protein VFP66_14380, partial [Candidatus Limnocylindrales bacterium]|nr:hypothetical protein [Candidatus Limnocylindrales bacterium]